MDEKHVFKYEEIKVSSKSHHWHVGEFSLADPVWYKGYWSRKWNETNRKAPPELLNWSQLSKEWGMCITQQGLRLLPDTQEKINKYLCHEWRAPKGKRNPMGEKAQPGEICSNLTAYSSYFISSWKNGKRSHIGLGCQSHWKEETEIFKEPQTIWQNIYRSVFHIRPS